jgi:hypothetical protein
VQLLPKNRLLRILLALCLVTLFAGYFAFSTFVFSPTEGGFQADVTTLIPKGVDFYLGKSSLEAELRPFPRLAEWDRIEATQAWSAFARHELPELDQRYGLSEKYQELARLPDSTAGMNPLGLFGGRRLALAGYFRGPDLAAADWAVYGRVGWRGKLIVSLLRYPQLLGLASRGLDVEVAADHVALSGGALKRPLFVARLRDVVVAATTVEQLRATLDLAARSGEKSFGQSALYFDTIENAPRNDASDELEFFVDQRRLMQELGLSSGPSGADTFVPALLGRLFQLGLANSLSGVLGFRSGVQLDLHAELSTELMSNEQKRLFGRAGREREWLINEAARLARADAGLFLYVEGSFADLATAVFASLEPALQANLEDTLRSTGEYADAAAFIAKMNDLFKGRVAVIVRPNDYPTAPEDPPNDGRPMPAWAVVLWTDGDEASAKKIQDLHDLVLRNQGLIGLEGRDGKKGVFKNLSRGFEVWEFWHKLVPGTGHVSTVVANEFYIVSNSFRMLGDLLTVYQLGGNDFPRLSERPEFAPLMRSGLAKANLIAWIDPRSLGKIRREVARQAASDAVLLDFDWRTERARIENDVSRRSYGGRRREDLSADEQQAFDKLVDVGIDEVEERLRTEQVPARQAGFEREILYSELASVVLLQAALDPRSLDLSLRALVPLDQ